MSNYYVTSVDQMGSATISGSTVVLQGMNAANYMYAAEDMLSVAGVQSIDDGDMKVTQNSSPNMSVNVAMGTALIKSASYSKNQRTIKFWRIQLDDTVNVSVGTNAGVSTRTDLVVLTMNPAITPSITGTGMVSVAVVAGTPGSGAPAVPTNSIALAEISVITGASSITTSNITDRRTKATIDPGDGFVYVDETWTASTAIAVTITGDKTSRYEIGNFVKFLQDGAVRSMRIKDKSYGTGVTTLTLQGQYSITTGSTHPITNPRYSAMKTPNGFADYLYSTGSRDGWIYPDVTAEYVSATSLRLRGDYSAYIGKGMKVRLKQGGSYKYFYTTADSSYDGTYTTVGVFAGSSYTLTNTTITDFYYSHSGVAIGHPVHFTHTLSITGFSAAPTITCIFSLVGLYCLVSFYANSVGTSNANSFTFTNLPFPSANFAVLTFGSFQAHNNGSTATTPGCMQIGQATTTGTLFLNWNNGSWTTTGNKYGSGSFSYPI